MHTFCSNLQTPETVKYFFFFFLPKPWDKCYKEILLITLIPAMHFGVEILQNRGNDRHQH